MKSILGNTRKVDITFHRNGRINISARVSKALGLTHGDVVDIIEDNGEVYLYVKHRTPTIGRHEGMVFRSKQSGNHCIASSVALYRYIASQCGHYDKLRLCCGNPITLNPFGIALPIITKHRYD